MKLRKKYTRSVSLIMVVTILLSICCIPASATDLTKTKSIEEHLSVYVDRMNEASEEGATLFRSVASQKESVQEDVLADLLSDGYEAYGVNADSYELIEETLDTDLSELGLNENSLAIIVAHGEDASPKSTAGSSFNYTYAGTTYKLRYLTVTAADNSAMAKTASVNVLSSTSRQLIINCLDTAIAAAISSVSTTLGVVADICGLSIEDFSTNAPSVSMILNAGVNWTRIYTQVWSDYDNRWTNGAFVTSVKINTYMSGYYYDSDTDAMTPIPTDSVYCTRRSSEYNDAAWRKQNGVLGYLNSTVYKNTVGNVDIKYGGVTKKTLYENF